MRKQKNSGIRLRLAHFAPVVVILFTCFATSPRFLPADLTAEQNGEICEAAWKAVRDNFYDSRFRGVDWDQVRSDYLPRFKRAGSRADVATLLRRMLGELHASHTQFRTAEEIQLYRNILPFFFERRSGRVFVADPLPPAASGRLAFGDEITGIEGADVSALVLPLFNRIYTPQGNPFFGPRDSGARLEVVRGMKPVWVSVPRVARLGGVEVARLDAQPSNIGVLRLVCIGGDIGPAMLRGLMERASGLDGLVIDLRFNSGGDIRGSLPLAGMLLGPGKHFYSELPRDGATAPVFRFTDCDYSRLLAGLIEKGVQVQFVTCAETVRFEKPVALLVNEHTESEAELFAAAIKEYGRARVFGARTAGATCGWSRALSLPHGMGTVAVPFTSSRSATGKDYEGMGIEADETIENRIEDFQARRDRVLEAALGYLKSLARRPNSARANR